MRAYPEAGGLGAAFPAGSLLSGATVLQVLPMLETGGVERGTVEMVQAIARAGGRAVVASAGGRLVNAVTHAGGVHAAMRLQSKDPWDIWRNAGRLARLVRDEGVDIVHARSRAPGWSALLAARRTGAHFVTTYHGVYRENAPWKRRYNAVMARGERVIAASRFMAELVTQRHGVDPARLRVIPRGVDPAVFDPDAISAHRIVRLLNAWNLPEGQKVVMLPGRLTRWKGQAVLIEALARLRRPDAVAVLVGADQGRTAYVAGLLRQARELGVADRIRLAGQCDDMPAALMLAEVVVAPSTEPEAFGRTVIEAQAMGRPVIASDHGGAAETVEQAVTGWRVPPGDPDALAATIDYVLDLSEADRRMLGAQARDAVRAHFTAAAMQDATIEVYRELLSAPS